MEDKLKSYQEYCELRDRFYASKGVQQYNAFLANKVAFYIFDENYHDLKKCIDEHFKLSMHGQLWSVDMRKDLHEHITEATRLMHNFLAGAKTLVDNTRYFVRNTYGAESAAAKEYQHMVKEFFAETPVSCFTQDLRNNLTHVCVPFVSSVMGGSKAHGRDLFTLKLAAKKFPKSWRWRALSEKYIEAANGEIDLELFAKEYRQIVTCFYGMLTGRVEQWGGEPWAEMAAMYERLTDYEKELDRKEVAQDKRGS